MERSGNPVKICVRHSRTLPRRSRVIVFTPLECLLPTLFSQSTERAGTHAGVWKQEFPPARRGVWGGIPFRLPIFRYALLWCAAHSVTHLMCAPSFTPSTPCLPKNILRSPTSRVHAQQILRIPATGCPAVKKSPGAIFRERSEPVGRVSGMIRATDSSHTSHRLLGGVSRRRCPPHTTAIPASGGN